MITIMVHLTITGDRSRSTDLGSRLTEAGTCRVILDRAVPSGPAYRSLSASFRKRLPFVALAKCARSQLGILTKP